MKPTKEDIMRYVEMMLDNDSLPGAMNAKLRAEIMNQVSEMISDVYVAVIFCSSLVRSLTVAPRFLLVSLNIAAILDETTIHQRREQIERMTHGGGLGDIYSVTLDRIKQSGGKSRLAMTGLMWISRSERPMSGNELCHALGVQIGSTDSNLKTSLRLNHYWPPVLDSLQSIKKNQQSAWCTSHSKNISTATPRCFTTLTRRWPRFA